MNLESIYKSAIKSGISPGDYWNNDLKHIVWAIEARHSASEEIERMAWERQRWAVCTLLQPHIQKGKTLAPSDLVRFPWEEGAKALQPKEGLDEETKQALYEKWDREAREKWGK